MGRHGTRWDTSGQSRPPAGGRAVAGSNPASPISRKPAFGGVFLMREARPGPSYLRPRRCRSPKGVPGRGPSPRERAVASPLWTFRRRIRRMSCPMAGRLPGASTEHRTACQSSISTASGLTDRWSRHGRGDRRCGSEADRTRPPWLRQFVSCATQAHLCRVGRRRREPRRGARYSIDSPILAYSARRPVRARGGEPLAHRLTRLAIVAASHPQRCRTTARRSVHGPDHDPPGAASTLARSTPHGASAQSEPYKVRTVRQERGPRFPSACRSGRRVGP